MSGAASMLSELNAAPIEVSDVSTPRANEVHCRVAAAVVKSLADFAWKQLESELILMLADDRRQTPAPSFAVHYLFANRRTDRLLHVSTYLEAGDPRLPSLAPFCYPASRFEREIRDLFGIRVVGHPDPRPLVKHGFWPEWEYPLRRDARISAFTDEGQPFPFTAVGGEGVYEIPVHERRSSAGLLPGDRIGSRCRGSLARAAAARRFPGARTSLQPHRRLRCHGERHRLRDC